MPAVQQRWCQQILPFGQRFPHPIQIGVGVAERPGDGSCHGARSRRVREAMRMDRGVGSRVGPVIGQGIQREIRRHQWSVLNVPLFWVAAEDDRLYHMIQLLREVSQSLPMVPVARVQVVEGRDAKH